MTPSSYSVPSRYYKKVLMAACLCLALCASGGAWGRSAGDTTVQESRIGAQETGIGDFAGKHPHEIVSAGEKFERFDDFIIRLKDDHKKDRILVCGMAVQLNRGMRLPEERTPLRKIIYKILKGLPDVSEIRKGLREEIKVRLNAFMGGERIRNIYFTTFVVL
ncbi:MAG: flagellar basal body-associated FliL family protein [Deltaproteobacteria bacterium]|nr:flagellar basal body-associated FliL family protein [Deltaproteobacteria bacterium]